MKDEYSSKISVKDRLILFSIFVIISVLIYLSSLVSIKLLVSMIILIIFLYTIVLLFIVNLFYKSEHKNYKFPKTPPSVAVVTYAYNNFKGIESQIDILLKLDYPIPYNVYLINDGTFEHLKNKKGLKLINIDKKYFKSGNIKAQIMNIGFKKLKEENILCMDGDTIPQKDVLMKMTPLLEGNTKAVIGCILPSNRNNLIEKLQVYEYILNFGLWARGLSLMNSMFVVVGALNLIKREAFLEVGGFDIYNIVEDEDLAFKFHERGYNIKHTIDARAETDVPSTFSKFKRQRIRWYRGAFYTWLKYKRFWFNSKLNAFGTFFLPYFLFVNIVGIALFLKYIIVNIRQQLTYIYYYLVELIVSKSFYIHFSLPSLNNLYFPPTLLFWLVSMSITLLFLIFSFNFLDYKLKFKELPVFLIFVMFFGLAIVLMYLESLVLEFLGISYKW